MAKKLLDAPILAAAVAEAVVMAAGAGAAAAGASAGAAAGAAGFQSRVHTPLRCGTSGEPSMAGGVRVRSRVHDSHDVVYA